MTWIPFTDDAGNRWAVDQLGLWLLCRQYVFARLVSERSKVHTESHLFSPDVHYVTTDFGHGFNTARDHDSQQLYTRLTQESLRNGTAAFEQLVLIKQHTSLLTNRVKELQRQASDATKKSIDRHVRAGEIGLTAATWILDISASALVTGATFLSGGFALSALSAGSALKGTATYEDTGNIGAAILQGTGSFVVGAISLAPQLATAGEACRTITLGMKAEHAAKLVTAAKSSSALEKKVLLIVGVQLNAGLTLATGLARGQGMRKSLFTAAATAGLGLLSPWIDTLLEKITMPVAMRLITDVSTDKLLESRSESAIDKMSEPEAKVSGRALQMCEVPTELRTSVSTEDFIRQMAMRPL